MMLILGALSVAFGIGAMLVVARRSAISEEELDRRLARLRRAELTATDEERERHEANLNAILNGERLIAAPRPPRRPAAGVEQCASTLARRVVGWLPYMAVLAGVAGLFTLLLSNGIDTPKSIHAIAAVAGMAGLLMGLTEHRASCSDRHAELMADLPSRWSAWRRHMFALFVIVRHQGLEDQVERIRRTHER